MFVTCGHSGGLCKILTFSLLFINATTVFFRTSDVCKNVDWLKKKLERRCSSYSYFSSALDGGEWSASRPGRALPPGKGPPVPIVQEAGWAPEPVWTQRLEEKSSCLCRGSNPSCPVRRQTIYWLSYRGGFVDWLKKTKLNLDMLSECGWMISLRNTCQGYYMF
jgi:hypothetical protein